MVSLLSDLSALLSSGFQSLGLDPAYGGTQVSDRPDLGHFQCNGALAAARPARTNPREIARGVVDHIKGDHRLDEVSIAGPGFINLRISDDALVHYLGCLGSSDRLGCPVADPPRKVIVDYGGPNVAKSMHVGHLRSTIIGDSIKRLFRFCGHEVLGDAHFGDWGLQMGMLIEAARRNLPDLDHFDDALPGPYEEPSSITLSALQNWYPDMAAEVEADEEVAGQARRATTALQSGNPGYLALWEHFVRVSRASQERDFRALGVEFDLWFGESTVRDLLGPLVRQALDSGHAYRSEGAVLVDVADPDDSYDLKPLVLETSHGAYLYGTTDVATIQLRVEQLDADLILYAVDARQAYHFEQVFRTARCLGVAGDAEMEHIRFGTMNSTDGTPFRTREGGVLRLSDLIEMVEEAAQARMDESDLAHGYSEAERAEIARQVGVGALKFGDLINNRTSNYIFDLRRFTSFEGKTGPYIQMAAVRMASILERASGAGYEPGSLLPPTGEVERRLMLCLLELPEVIERATELRAPNHLAEFAHRVASHFSRFYETCHILSEPDPRRQSSWLALVQTTRKVVDLLTYLLGISIPARM